MVHLVEHDGGYAGLSFNHQALHRVADHVLNIQNERRIANVNGPNVLVETVAFVQQMNHIILRDGEYVFSLHDKNAKIRVLMSRLETYRKNSHEGKGKLSPFLFLIRGNLSFLYKHSKLKNEFWK